MSRERKLALFINIIMRRVDSAGGNGVDEVELMDAVSGNIAEFKFIDPTKYAHFRVYISGEGDGEEEASEVKKLCDAAEKFRKGLGEWSEEGEKFRKACGFVQAVPVAEEVEDVSHAWASQAAHDSSGDFSGHASSGAGAEKTCAVAAPPVAPGIATSAGACAGAVSGAGIEEDSSSSSDED